MNTRARLTLICALTAVGACSTTTPIGEVPSAGTSGEAPTGAAGYGAAGTGAAVTGAAGQAPSGPYVPSGSQVLNDPPFTNPSGVSGDWVGYLQNYSQYFTGSDVIKLHLGNGAITLVQGTGTPPAPPTYAFQAWPAAIIDELGGPGPGIGYPNQPISGFTYVAHGVTWQGTRLKFNLNAADPWAPWCALQPTYPFGGGAGRWSCNGGNALAATGTTCMFLDGDVNAPCTLNHQQMCQPDKICGCNATGCGVANSGGPSFDITFFGDHAIGSMQNYNLILMPAAP